VNNYKHENGEICQVTSKNLISRGSLYSTSPIISSEKLTTAIITIEKDRRKNIKI
jgi:hypothetical protein